MALKLKATLEEMGVSQAELAIAIRVSQPGLNLILNHDRWPKTADVTKLKNRIRSVLEDNFGATAEQLTGIFNTDPLPSKGNQFWPKDHSNEVEEIMLLRKHVLSHDAKRIFSLMRDPFSEVRTAEDIFLTPDIRYVRESLRAIAKHGGFAAIIGESGAGKSTLRRDIVEWANKEDAIIVIEPYIIGMEENDIKGKTLKAAHITESVMEAVAPGQNLMRSPEVRFRQVHKALKESHRVGNRHVLIIEEAHSLPIPTLKHLKRFFELEDGFAKLLSIILIGQPELAMKLDERNPAVREIVQRCEMVTLRPLDTYLEGYLQHRFKLAGTDLNKMMLPEAIEALRTKLTNGGHFSVLYPLAVNNVVTAALNEAATLGIPQLNAELIQGV